MQRFESTVMQAIHPLAVMVVASFSHVVEGTNVTSSAANSSAEEATKSKCIRCVLWSGERCVKYRDCVFCDVTSSCPEPYKCRRGICEPQRATKNNNEIEGPDPIGKIIALILLAIFFVGLCILCLRLFGTSCNSGVGRCCVLQCAMTVNCCCDWKMGHGTGTRGVAPSSENHLDGHGGAGTGQAQIDPLRRMSLRPVPPPAYVELFPTTDTTRQRGETDNLDEESSPADEESEREGQATQPQGQESQSNQREASHERSASNSSSGITSCSSSTASIPRHVPEQINDPALG